MWKGWEGKEPEYYKECAKKFHSLTEKDLIPILGETFEKQKEELEHSSKAFNFNVTPEYLYYSEDKWVRFYKDQKEQTISPAQHLILKHFDGHTKTDAIVQKAKRLPLNINSLLKKAIQYQILQPVPIH